MDQNYPYYSQVYYPQTSTPVYVSGGPHYQVPNAVYQYQTVPAPGPVSTVVMSPDNYPVMNFSGGYTPSPGEITFEHFSGAEMSNSSAVYTDNFVQDENDGRFDQPSHKASYRDRGRGKGRGNWSGRGRYNDPQASGASRNNSEGYSTMYSDNSSRHSSSREPRGKTQNDHYNQNESYRSKGNNSRYQNSGPRQEGSGRGRRRPDRDPMRESEEHRYSPSNYNGRPLRNSDRRGQQSWGNRNNGRDRGHDSGIDRYAKEKHAGTDSGNSGKSLRFVNSESQRQSRTKNSDGLANLTDEEKEQLGAVNEDVLVTEETRQADQGHTDLVDKVADLIGSKNQGKSSRPAERVADFKRDNGKRSQGSDRGETRKPFEGRDGPTPRSGNNSKQFAQRKREVQNSGPAVETQRDSLIEQLRHSDYECMVCCSNIRCEVAIWGCNNCYHIFHLFCIKKWARSPAAVIEVGGGWRCPGCQNVTDRVPNQYRCFCGKQLDPPWDRYETPHSCGEVCGKQRNTGCPHPCNILCHPGPCPPCEATVNKTCECGKTKQFLKCAQSSKFRCDKVCEKELNCTKHFCQAECHKGPCGACDHEVQQACYGEHTSRTVTCGTEESLYTSFTCENTCNKQLDCGQHVCKKVCHDGPCKPCPLQPSLVTRCPCGQTELSSLTDISRETCLDPIPVCGNMCGKPLSCGPVDDPHVCEMMCHEGECGVCEGTTSRTCRCGRLEKELSCTEARQFTADNPLKCDRRCNKKKHCGKHKCNQPCCVEKDHICDQACGRKLNCGLHKCDLPCHRGNCQPCLQAGFEELTCHCGTEVIYPPVACGTRPPECRKVCTRIHPCNHPVRHTCNPDGECPPCAVLTEKRCMGNHEMRKNIPCFREDISCGLLCNTDLPCRQHKCRKTCHKGPCLEDGEICTQQCLLPRPECAHPCGAPCHSGATCPKTACRTMIEVKCKCGNRKSRVKCLSGAVNGPDIADYQRVATLNLASSLTGLQTGQTVDITELAALTAGQRHRLDCDKECAVLERNKRVALALEIRNPDLSAKLGNPGYSQFLRDFAKQNPQHVSSVEKALSDLVQSAKQSKQPFRRHPFPPMNMNQRRLIHELAEFYGCETESYDAEPKKNVVATAHKDRCWLPSVTLTSLVQRELLPKAPMPIPHSHNENDLRVAVREMKLSTDVFVEPKRQEKKSNAPVVDYFDMTD